jgi:hypothetical protein
VLAAIILVRRTLQRNCWPRSEPLDEIRSWLMEDG